MSKQRKIKDEELINAYNKFKTLSKIASELNVPEISIWRRCKQLNLTFEIGGVRNKIPLEEILEGLHPQYQTNKLKKRLIKENIFEDKCFICNLSEWNKKPIILHLDHINGKSKDHRLCNLRLLCPNCHGQTDTWCGRNI